MNMKNNYQLSYKNVAITVLMLFIVNKGFAQLIPLNSQYYVNRYIANPAMAGAERGNSVNLAYYSQWNNMPGAPVVQNITYTHGWDKGGLGLNFNLDKAGLQKQTRVMGTYAYRIGIDSNKMQLHFGVSGGIMSQRLNEQDVIGQA
jgi:type IX secretion system PorP/SprF family membrane protein